MTPKILNFPKIEDPRGNLTFIQYPDHIPFEIQEVSIVSDLIWGDKMKRQTCYEQEEVIIALSGSLNILVTLVNGNTQKYSLNNCIKGLYLPRKSWGYIENFSPNAVALSITNKISLTDLKQHKPL